MADEFSRKEVEGFLSKADGDIFAVEIQPVKSRCIVNLSFAMDAFLVRSNLCGLAALAFLGGSYHDHCFCFFFTG